jgi:S1-C subfamily serine protease
VSQVPDDSQGKKARCPKCGLLIQIPVMSAAAAKPPASAAPPLLIKPTEAVKQRPTAPAPVRPPAPPLAVKVQPAKPNAPVSPSPAPKADAIAPGHAVAAQPKSVPINDETDDDLEFDRGEADIRRPARPRRQTALDRFKQPWVLVAAGGGSLLVIGILVLLVAGGSKPAEAKRVAENNPPPKKAPVGDVPPKNDAPAVKEQPTPTKEVPSPVKEQPKPAVPPPPRQVEIPPGPTPPTIDAANTRKVKKATTYLRVTMKNGQVAEGSGFFAAEPGLVFTNAHVLGMLGNASSLPSKVEVVMNSGEPEEFTRAGQVLGVDRVNDLGVLRVAGLQEGLPDPLPVDTTRSLTEIQEVYVFGFPFGASLGKNITVSKSSISSLRKDPDGTVNQVQVNGGMNPGNSGGPVVDARGVVIGVAVSIIRGTQINFAVPGEKLQGLLRGRVSGVQFGEPYLDNAQTKLPLQVTCLDPLGRLRDLKVEIWAGESSPPRPMSMQQQPPALAGDSPRQSLALAYNKGQASADIPVPAVPSGKVLWVQPVLTDGGGFTQWAAATPFRVADHPPLTRQPALLEQRFDAQPERTLKWTSSHQLQMSNGPRMISFGAALEVEAVEMAKKDPKGGQLNLFLAGSKLSLDDNGKKTPMNLKALQLLRGRFITFTTDPTGFLLQRVQPNLNPGQPPDVRTDYTEALNRIANSYEMTCLSVPNRQLQPKETWQARLPMLLTGDGRPEVVDMHLTCTYEGMRQALGRSQAVIGLTGTLKHRQPGRDNVAGKVVGKADFDVGGGYLSLADLKVETEIGGVNANVNHVVDVNLKRTPGNTLKITLPKPPPVLAKGKILIQEDGQLDQASPTNNRDKPGVPYKLYSPTLTAGTTYIIEMNNTRRDNNLDPYLIVNNPKGQKVAEDDDSGGELNSRIVLQATETGVYQIYATTLQQGQTGPFRFILAEATVDGK